MVVETQTLYRPVGLKELLLIAESDYTAFPPRLDWQPIFYPVLNAEYAAQIAHDWNTKDPASGYGGFVTAFDVDVAYLVKFEEHVVGGTQHRELWVPAEELETFNSKIVGKIRIEAAFYGDQYAGPMDWPVTPTN